MTCALAEGTNQANFAVNAANWAIFRPSAGVARLSASVLLTQRNR
jgi:hypothetical protein